jgi:hypothetical protein
VKHYSFIKSSVGLLLLLAVIAGGTAATYLYYQTQQLHLVIIGQLHGLSPLLHQRMEERSQGAMALSAETLANQPVKAMFARAHSQADIGEQGLINIVQQQFVDDEPLHAAVTRLEMAREHLSKLHNEVEQAIDRPLVERLPSLYEQWMSTSTAVIEATFNVQQLLWRRVVSPTTVPQPLEMITRLEHWRELLLRDRAAIYTLVHALHPLTSTATGSLAHMLSLMEELRHALSSTATTANNAEMAATYHHLENIWKEHYLSAREKILEEHDHRHAANLLPAYILASTEIASSLDTLLAIFYKKQQGQWLEATATGMFTIFWLGWIALATLSFLVFAQASYLLYAHRQPFRCHPVSESDSREDPVLLTQVEMVQTEANSGASAPSQAWQEELMSKQEAIMARLAQLSQQMQSLSPNDQTPPLQTLQPMIEKIHILALNARIEATRMGDTGAGIGDIASKLREQTSLLHQQSTLLIQQEQLGTPTSQAQIQEELQALHTLLVQWFQLVLKA